IRDSRGRLANQGIWLCGANQGVRPYIETVIPAKAVIAYPQFQEIDPRLREIFARHPDSRLPVDGTFFITPFTAPEVRARRPLPSASTNPRRSRSEMPHRRSGASERARHRIPLATPS